MDQICAHRPQFTLSSLTCHRFVIASIAISSKGFCDAFCTNSHYAKVGGISVSELNLLEREFLSMIDWRLTVRALLHFTPHSRALVPDFIYDKCLLIPGTCPGTCPRPHVPLLPSHIPIPYLRSHSL